MLIGDLFETLDEIKQNQSEPEIGDSANKPQKKCQLQNISIDLDFEICIPQSDQASNTGNNNSIDDEQQNQKLQPTQSTSNVIISIREDNVHEKFDLINTKCIIIADKILHKYMNENEYKYQKRKYYSIGFIKLLFELKIAKSFKITKDPYLIGVQQLIFLHLNLIGAKKSLHNYQQFINQKPIQPLDAYYDQLLLQKFCLIRIIKNISSSKKQNSQKVNKEQIQLENPIKEEQNNHNELNKNNDIQQTNESNSDKHVHLMLRSLSKCGPLIAHMCMYKIESKFVNSFKVTNEESICDLWVQFFEKILQVTYDNERTINFQEYLVLFKVFDSFYNEVEYFGIDMRQHLEDSTNITIQEKVSQVQDVFKKIFEKLSLASKMFLKVKMQDFLQESNKYILNSLLLCELISIEPDTAFKIFQQFLQLMLNQPQFIIEELGEQAIEKVFLNLISYIFKEKITNSTQYIQNLVNKQLFIDIKTQIIQNNPFGHLILNQILYHILEAEIQFTTRYLLYQVDSKPEEVWEILAEIFKLLSDKNQIVFLKGFRLIKRFLEELIDIHKRNEQIIHSTKVCQVYSELCVKNTLIWGQRSGIQEHTEVIQFTYPEIQKQLKLQMIQLMDMIKQEDDFLIRYLDQNNLAFKKKIKNLKNKKKNNANTPSEEQEQKEEEDQLEFQKFSLAYHCMFTLLEFKYKVLCSNGLYYINCICTTLNKSISQGEFEEIFLYCLNCCSPLSPQIQKKSEKESSSNQAQIRHQATELFGRLRRFSDSDAQPVLMVMTEVCKDYLDNLPLLLKRLSVQMKNSHSHLTNKNKDQNKNPKQYFMMIKFWKDSRQSFLKLLQNPYFTGQHYEMLKQIRQCELVIFLFKKAILNLYSVGHYINSNEFYDNYAYICQKAIESQEILSVSFIDEMCSYLQYKIDKAHIYAAQHPNYQLALQLKFHKYEKGTFISDTKWTNSFDKFIFRNLRLPKMIFKVTLLATKLKRVDLSLIPSPYQTERRFSQRYSRMIREISYQIVKYNCRNIVLMRSNTEGIPNSHNSIFIPIMCSELYASCSMILSSVLKHLQAQNITIDFSNFQLAQIEKNMLRDVFFSFLKHHDNFYSFLMRDMVIQPRIFVQRYLISSEILPHYKEEIENCDSYFKISTEFTSYMKHIFSSMPIYAKYNEQIPEKLAESFFDMTKEYHKDRSLTDREKTQLVCFLEDLALRILNLYLHSTYDNQVSTLKNFKLLYEINQYNNQVRTRSSHINKVIYSYINLKIKNQDEILQQKKIISIFFLKQMELHLQDFIPKWNVETHGGYILRDYLLQKYKQIYQQSDIENKLLLYKPNSLDPILNACTLAMIMNLLCRLIQESPEMDPSLDQGMKYVFGQSWISCKYFLSYISKVMEETKFRKIGTDESNTLDFDPIRYSMVVTEHLLNHSADIILKLEKSQNMQKISNIDLKDVKYQEIFRKDNWQELFDLSGDIIKHYLNMEIIQIEKFQNHTILGIRSAPLRKFLGTMTMSIYQEPNEQKIKRILKETLPLLQKTPIKQTNFSGWTNSLFKLLRQLCDSVFIFSSSHQFKKECLKLHMLDIFYDRFKCEIIEQYEYIKLKNFSGSIFAAQPDIFLEILNEFFDIQKENDQSHQTNRMLQNSQIFKLKDKKVFFENDLKINKIPSLCQELITFLVESFAASLQTMLGQIYQSKERVYHSTFSHEVCLKILIQLCGKYPLIIPYVIAKELNACNLLVQSLQTPHLYEILHQHIKQKGNKITFVEYLFLVSPFSFNISRQFFKFITNSLSYIYIQQDCPYGTKDENGNVKKIIIGSNLEFKNYLIELHEQQIELFIQKQNILNSDQDSMQLRDIIVNYYQLHLNGGYSSQLNISIDEEQYLKNHQMINLPLYYLQRKEQSLRRCYQTLSKIITKCSNSVRCLNILTAIDFYSMYNQIYKEIVQIQYSYFTNKYYAKGIHNLKTLKQLSNKQLVSFMTEKNVEQVILNINEINKQKESQFISSLVQSKQPLTADNSLSINETQQNTENSYQTNQVDGKKGVCLPQNILLINETEANDQSEIQQVNDKRKYSQSPDNYKNIRSTEIDTYLRKNSKESFAKFYVSRGAWSTCVYNSTSKINTLEYIKTQVQQNILTGDLSNQFYSECLEWQINYMSEDEDTELFFSQYIYECEDIDKWPKKNNNLKPQNIYQTLLLEFAEDKQQEYKKQEVTQFFNNPQKQNIQLFQKLSPTSNNQISLSQNKSKSKKANTDSENLMQKGLSGNQKTLFNENISKNQTINIDFRNLQLDNQNMRTQLTNQLRQPENEQIRIPDTQQIRITENFQNGEQVQDVQQSSQVNNLNQERQQNENGDQDLNENNLNLDDQQFQSQNVGGSNNRDELSLSSVERVLDQQFVYPEAIYSDQYRIMDEPKNFMPFDERKDEVFDRQPRREEDDEEIDDINNNQITIQINSVDDGNITQNINNQRDGAKLSNTAIQRQMRALEVEENIPAMGNTGNSNIQQINEPNSRNMRFSDIEDRYALNSSSNNAREMQQDDEDEEEKDDYPYQIQSIMNYQNGFRQNNDALFYESLNKRGRTEEIRIEDELREDFVDEIEEDQQNDDIIDEEHAFDQESQEILLEFDWTLLDFPKNALNLYGIDKQLFRLATDEEKVEMLVQAQERYQQDKEREQADLITRVSQRSTFNFEAHGFNSNCLDDYEIDHNYFYSLPDEIKLEVLNMMRQEINPSQNSISPSHNPNRSNFQYPSSGNQSLSVVDEAKTPKKQNLSPEQQAHYKLKMMIKREQMAVKSLVASNDFQSRLNYRKTDIKQIVSFLKNLDAQTQEGILKLADNNLVEKLPKEMRQRAINLRRQFNQYPAKDPFNGFNNNTLNDLSTKRNITRRMYDLVYLPSIDDLYYEDSDLDSDENSDSNISMEGDQILEGGSEIDEKDSQIISQGYASYVNQSALNNSYSGSEVSGGQRRFEDFKENDFSTIKKDKGPNQFDTSMTNDHSSQIDKIPKQEEESEQKIREVNVSDYGINSSEYFMSLDTLDDDILIGIIHNAIFAPIRMQSSDNFAGFTDNIFKVLKLLSLSPINGYKIADALTFYLSLSEQRYITVIKHLPFYKDQEDNNNIVIQRSEIQSRICSLIRRLLGANVCVPLYIQGVINTNKPLKLSSPTGNQIQTNQMKGQNMLGNIPSFSNNYMSTQTQGIQVSSYAKYLIPIEFITKMRNEISKGSVSTVYSSYLENSSVFELGIKLIGEQILSKSQSDDGLLIVDYILGKSEFASSSSQSIPINGQQNNWRSSLKNTPQGLNSEDIGKDGFLGRLRDRKLSHDVNLTTNQLAESNFSNLLSQNRVQGLNNPNTENEFFNYDQLVVQQQYLIRKKNSQKQFKKNQQLNNKKNKKNSQNRRASAEPQFTSNRHSEEHNSLQASPTNAVNSMNLSYQMNGRQQNNQINDGLNSVLYGSIENNNKMKQAEQESNYSNYVTHNDKYILGEQIINTNFMKTFCEIIFKCNKRIKTNNNLLGIVKSLIKFRSANFVTILCGILEQYGRQLAEIVQKIQQNTENFKIQVLQKNNYNAKVPLTEQISDPEQLGIILSKFEIDTVYKLSGPLDFREIFHNLRHFIKDMKHIFEQYILDEAIKLYTQKERKQREKEIKKINKQIQTIINTNTPAVSMLDIGSCLNFTSRHNLELTRLQEKQSNQQSMSAHNLQYQSNNIYESSSSHTLTPQQKNVQKMQSINLFENSRQNSGIQNKNNSNVLPNLNQNLSIIEIAALNKHKKDELIQSMKQQISQKQKELKSYMEEQSKKIRVQFTNFLKKKVYAIRSLNLAFRECIEYIFALQEIVGQDFESNNSQTLELYYNWKYALKSIIILHQFVNPYNHQEEFKRQFNQNASPMKRKSSNKADIPTENLACRKNMSYDSQADEVNCSSLNSSQDYNVNSLDFVEEMEDDSEGPRLSRLFTHEETDPTKLPTSILFRSVSASNQPKFDIDSTFSLMYMPKVMSTLEQFIYFNSDRLDNFHHFIRNADKKDKLPLKLKLSFLRSLARQNAIDKQPNLQDEQNQSIKFIIDREKTWYSTIEYLSRYTPADMTTKQIKIQFKDEDGIDYGGLTREWLALLSKEVFNPDYCLFQLSANKRSIQPSPLSMLIPDHLNHFLFLGRLVGKSLVENWHFDINFCKSFLKHMLKKNLYVNDLEDIDPELSRSLIWMLENDVDDLMYDFSYVENILGQQKIIELINDGQNVAVTEDNKKKYVKDFCTAKMILNIEKQAKAFIRGLEQIIPREALELFNEQELGLHLTGMPTVDIEDMKKNTQYSYYTENNRVVKWFWEVLQEENEITRANFLFFLTGSFKVPYGGFKNYPLKIDRGVSPDSLPVAHTCFNQIDLPEYESKEKLKEKLLIAISEGSSGFHIG